MLRPLTLGRTIVNTELVRADVLLSNNDIIDVGGRQFLFLHTILNKRLLSAAKSGDTPRLQVLRCVLGPIRALTAKWPSLAAGAAATWRRRRASIPVRLDRPGHRGRACVGRFAAAICARTVFTGQRASHSPCGPHGSLRQLERAGIASDQPGMYNLVCLNW